VVGCWHGCLSGASCRLAYGPADATATPALVQSRLGFTSLVPAHPGSPGQRAVKWVCVCVLPQVEYYTCVCRCAAQVRKSSLSQVLNAEAYMLFYKKGVGLAKMSQDDGCSVRTLSASGKLCDSATSRARFKGRVPGLPATEGLPPNH